MVLRDENGWLGADGEYFGSPEGAHESLAKKRKSFYKDPIAPADRPAPQILLKAPLLVFTNPWIDLVERLLKHPSGLFKMDPRKFEELIAEMFLARGHVVELTPASRDGGFDVLVPVENTLGKHLYLVECKRYAAHNKINVGLVRELYGVIELQRATLGMIVTTSDFTPDARELARKLENRMTLKNFNNIIEMLNGYLGKQ